jgi:cytochrome c oxidase cbb3-type subunit 2
MNRELDGQYITDLMRAHQMVGVPYSDEMMEAARADFLAQANPENDWDATDALIERYPGAQTRNFDGQPQLTEMDALVAYLQVLGTMVDFSTFEPDPAR